MSTRQAAPPIVDITSVTKQYGGLGPLRIRRLHVAADDRIALGGLDRNAAEALVHLITGASLPDEGTLRIAGKDTREIATDTEWLASLDQFGLVTSRAVLIGALPVADNLALPLTLSIDPMADDVRAAVEAIADEVGIPRARLARQAGTLLPAELVRVHLARALVVAPRMLLLEHPTAGIDAPADRVSLGRTIRRIAASRGIGWLALTDDASFVRASAAASLTLCPATGDIVETRWWGGSVAARRWTS